MVADAVDVVAVDLSMESRGQSLVDDELWVPDDTGQVGILADRPKHQHFEDIWGRLLAHPMEDAIQAVADITPRLAVGLARAVDTKEHLLLVRQAKGSAAQIDLQNVLDVTRDGIVERLSRAWQRD